MDPLKPFQKLAPSSKRNHLFFDLPIAQRLTLGFLAAALIATVVTTAIGVQRTQSLQRQSSFYQKLLQTDTKLTTAANYLALMNSVAHTIVSLEEPPVNSQETLRDNEHALWNLIQSYDAIFQDFEAQDLIKNYPEQVRLLNDTGHGLQVQQQYILHGSTLREWHYYSNSLKKFLSNTCIVGDFSSTTPIQCNQNITVAQLLIRTQEEPLNADSTSALRSLLHYEETLTNSAADVVKPAERYQLIITVAGALFAGLSIALVGLLISGTLVNRLKQLRRIAQAIEEGKTNEHIKVIGRDEIADISKSVNSMLEIIAAEEEITAAYQLREQFIASVSHELRNPLTEVIGWLETIRDHHGHMDMATQIRFINNATYGCLDIMHLINNVLDAAQSEHQMKAPFLEEVSITKVVYAVLDHLDPREKNVYNIQIAIPRDMITWADEQYIRQVLRNLLSNALKYAPRHTPILISAMPEEQTAQSEKGPQLRICVQDAGLGIPPDEIPHLFQKFKRLKRDTVSSTHGTGLGLYISKQLVEAMNGKIWVESSGIEGEGSSFYFTLPAIVPANSTTSNSLVCSSYPF